MASNMPTSNKSFRVMLLNLSSKIREEELQNMKFLCKTTIPAGRRDRIETPIALFEALEERGKLSLTELKDLLKNGCQGRTDVVDIVCQYEVQGSLSHSTETTDAVPTHSTNLTKEIIFLAVKLGRKHKHFLRRLGIEEYDLENLEVEHRGNIREFTTQALYHWVRTNPQNATKETLVSALRAENCTKLAKDLESGNFS